ncbi:MAG: hypothetical protein H7Z43_05595 [Clostridia bacterium]|nr:hypothetical protein [Deltaproteobacteria bacterium]
MRILAAIMILAGSAACAKDPAAPTEIYVNVAATLTKVDHVVLTARNPDGIEDVINRPTTDRDISLDAIVIRLTPATGFGLEFLLVSEGYREQKRVVASGETIDFASNDRRDLEVVMNERFAEDDFDRDGYRLCGTGPVNDAPCDCDDLDLAVNPFSREICGNGVDDDCTGVADDGC